MTIHQLEAATTPSEHPNIRTLRHVYADLTRIAAHCAPDVVLHTADRGLPGATTELHGPDAVEAHERSLVELTGRTLLMDIEHITANDHFGTVLGTIRAHPHGHRITMPFCGLWRFRHLRIVEHWENAYHPALLSRLLTKAR